MFEVIPSKFGANDASSDKNHFMASSSPSAFPKKHQTMFEWDKYQNFANFFFGHIGTKENSIYCCWNCSGSIFRWDLSLKCITTLSFSIQQWATVKTKILWITVLPQRLESSLKIIKSWKLPEKQLALGSMKWHFPTMGNIVKPFIKVSTI